MNLNDLYLFVSKLDYSPDDKIENGEGIWDGLFEKLLDENLQKIRAHFLRLLLCKYGRVIDEARSGKINLAQQICSETERISSGLTNEEYMLIKALAFPAKAYLCYKESRYVDAINLTFKAMEAGEQLEAQGYSFFHYHRIQQMHNVCRVLFKDNQLQNAFKCSRELLEYLMNGRKPISFCGSWNSDLLGVAHKELKSAMILQVVHEVLSVCERSHWDEPQKNHYYEMIFAGLNDKFSPSTKEELVLSRWFAAMDFIHAGEFSSFYSLALPFLEQESRHFDLFKYILIKSIIYNILPLQKDSFIILNEETLNRYVSEKLNIRSLPLKSIIA